jgi:phage terminase small subunit
MAGTPMKLTLKQARFVQEYLIDLNAAQAAIRAGYSAKTARVIGHENLTKPDIAAAIEKAMAERAERTELTADWVVDELRKIAGANMADYVQYTPEGAPHLDFAALTRDQAAAVREMTVEDVVGGKRVSFKLHDKLGALDKLGRHLGIFREKQQSEVKVAVDVVELRETVLRTLDRLAAARAAAGDR